MNAMIVFTQGTEIAKQATSRGVSVGYELESSYYVLHFFGEDDDIELEEWETIPASTLTEAVAFIQDLR